MKNRPMSNYNSTVTEWDDNILFDADDPDFCNISAAVSNVLSNNGISSNSNTIVPAQTVNFKVPNQTNSMLMASVQGTNQFNDRCMSLGRNSISMSSSLSDLVGSPLEISAENVLTIEELRQHMGSCFTCGVSWTDDHVSLDCQECGGYSLERPCPLCDGKCGVQWKRDFTMSHACSKARWVGVCPSYLDAASTMNLPTTAAIASAVNSSTATSCATAAVAATQLRLAHDLCARLEQLSAAGTHI